MMNEKYHFAVAIAELDAHEDYHALRRIPESPIVAEPTRHIRSAPGRTSNL